MPLELPRRQFLYGATLVEGGLLLLAVVLAWFLEIPLRPLLTADPQAVLWGVGATIPLVLIFWATYYRPKAGFRTMKDFLHEALGPPLAACRWYELLWVAALAGLGEELLFRGVLQTWLQQWGEGPSWILSNLVFAFCHAITPTYVVMAFLMGLILSGLMEVPHERSLLTPIITHGLYDFVAFIVIARDWRKQQPQSSRGYGDDPASADIVES